MTTLKTKIISIDGETFEIPDLSIGCRIDLSLDDREDPELIQSLENRQEKELIVTNFDDESMLAWVDGIEESIQYQWIEAIYA